MSALTATGAVVAVVMAGGWALSVIRRNVTLVDSLWPTVFALAAWAMLILGPGEASSGRSRLMLAMVTAWAVSLGAHLTARNWGRPEDFRYASLRKRFKPFALWSLLVVFGLQGALVLVVSLPVQAVMGDATPSPLGWLDWAGLTVWLVGWAFETIGDAQLRRFLADGSNKGKVMDEGLWRYARHPNYFGDALLWWGVYLVAVSAGGAWTFVGPLVMTFLLLRVSGVALLERSIKSRRPGYGAYAARTSAFIPLPPRRAGGRTP